MRDRVLGVFTWLLLAAGSFLAVYGGMDYWESRSAQSEIAQSWQQTSAVPESPFSAVPQSPSSPTETDKTRKTPAAPGISRPRIHTNAPAAGAAVAKLSIPRLDTVLYVVEGTRDRDLKRGPGHLAGTVLPGEDGNCVIAGHRDTHFSVLKNIQNGDEVILERAGETFHYRVDGTKVVMPTNTASLQPTDEPVLNLITCYPFRYVGSAPKRFIVHAQLEGPTLQASR